MMDEKEVARFLQAAIDSLEEDIGFDGPYTDIIKTFEDGINTGLIIPFEDGSEFKVTIVNELLNPHEIERPVSESKLWQFIACKP